MKLHILYFIILNVVGHKSINFGPNLCYDNPKPMTSLPVVLSKAHTSEVDDGYVVTLYVIVPYSIYQVWAWGVLEIYYDKRYLEFSPR